ncbi:MAG TPA: hypothetical protein VML54_14755, partial [Candidatus Limnocylindrales bacterium]|nr:hypothetical protein [Candidatus Limnocylindrales bacterium]
MTDQSTAAALTSGEAPAGGAPDSAARLIERLRSHRMLGDLPAREIEWLVRHGTARHFRAGEVLTSPELGPVEVMTILFSGQLVFYRDRQGSRRKVIVWRGGDITGLLPYSRLSRPPGEGVFEEDSEVVQVHGRDFPEMIRECQKLTATLVQLMLDRARLFTQTDLHAEKMVSLGRLAAGLAHELDNPASAVIRSAKLLVPLLRQSDAAAQVLGASGIDAVELEIL